MKQLLTMALLASGLMASIQVNAQAEEDKSKGQALRQQPPGKSARPPLPSTIAALR